MPVLWPHAHSRELRPTTSAAPSRAAQLEDPRAEAVEPELARNQAHEHLRKQVHQEQQQR